MTARHKVEEGQIPCCLAQNLVLAGRKVGLLVVGVAVVVVGDTGEARVGFGLRAAPGYYDFGADEGMVMRVANSSRGVARRVASFRMPVPPQSMIASPKVLP